MTSKVQYRPRMRQSERVTSTLAVPLALSSAILVVLLVLATAPQVPGLHHAHESPPTATIALHSGAVATSSHSVSLPPTRSVSMNTQPDGSMSSSTSTPPPRSSLVRALNVISNGVVSGGSAPVSYVAIVGPHTVQFSTDQPIAISIWDGACAIDPLTQIVSNPTPTTCTVQLQSDTFMPWQLLELA